MALIPVQHVVADHFPVDPDWVYATSGTITSGRLVDLDGSGFVRLVPTAGNYALGLAADNLSNVGGNTPYASNLTIGAGGSFTRSTENRVSDFFDETLASGRMTVYHGGGRFLTDQFATVTFAPSQRLYATATGTITNAAAGNNIVIGLVVGTPAVPSGVPGTAISGSTSLGTFLDMMLLV